MGNAAEIGMGLLRVLQLAMSVLQQSVQQVIEVIASLPSAPCFKGAEVKGHQPGVLQCPSLSTTSLSNA